MVQNLRASEASMLGTWGGGGSIATLDPTHLPMLETTANWKFTLPISSNICVPWISFFNLFLLPPPLPLSLPLRQCPESGVLPSSKSLYLLHVQSRAPRDPSSYV